MNARKRGPVPRFALTPDEAAESIGMGLTTFKQDVMPELRMIRRGRLRLIPTTDLEQWVDANAERVPGA